MKFQFKKGFIPNYYKESEEKSCQSKLKLCVCVLFLINMFTTPLSISKSDLKDKLVEELEQRKYEKTIKLKVEEEEKYKTKKKTSVEDIINITAILKDRLMELSYCNEKINLKTKFSSVEEGENYIESITKSINKELNYTSTLEEDYYIFFISED